MWYTTKYNLELFKIDEKQERHKHFLIFMIRKIYWYRFSWTINRKDFIKKWINKYKFNKNTIKWIFDKWIKENKFIHWDFTKRWKKYYTLKSNNYKDKINQYVIIENDILNKINSVNDFYTFCFLVNASRPIKRDKNDNRKIEFKDFNKIRWRTLRTIWKDFWWMKKDNVLYHINRWRFLFKEYFNVITRKVTYKWNMIPISSLYFFDWITYLNNKMKKWKNIFTFDLNFYFNEMEDYELKKLWVKIKRKDWIRELLYEFGDELKLDFWNQFIDKSWKILFDELYENYDDIIEKVINQYD